MAVPRCHRHRELGAVDMAKKQMNPKKLPWFPFYTSAWLGSSTVLNMTMVERGIYITLMAHCWQNGNVPWSRKTLSKLLGVDPRTVGNFMEKYGRLTDISCNSLENSTDSRLSPPDVTLPKLQEFAETLEKNAPPKIQSRREETRGDETNETNGGRPSSDAPKPIFTPSVTETKAMAVPVAVIPNPATPALPVKLLGDIRDWNEEKFGIPADRLRNCIIYQLDYAKDDYFRKSEITPASMERSKFITLLNDNTPAGWTPEKHQTYTRKPKAAAPAPAEPSKYQFKEII